MADEVDAPVTSKVYDDHILPPLPLDPVKSIDNDSQVDTIVGQDIETVGIRLH